MPNLGRVGLCLALVAAMGTAGCGGGGETCTPEASTTCVQGVTYWLDSCGGRGEVDQNCICGCADDGLACRSQCPCVPDCAGKECGDDGCEGSCGTCTAPEACDEAGRCVCTPACTDKCCDSDGCGGTCPDACASGTHCEAGTCDCAPDCTDGAMRCTGEVLETCTSNVWHTVVDCATAAQVCEGGACVTCHSGDSQCNADAVEVCTAGSWTQALDCTVSNKICHEAACLTCVPASVLCTGTMVETCANDSWEAVVDCALADRECVDGECIPCTNGTLRCTEDVLEICTADAWQTVIDCAAQGQMCLDEACQAICTPDCAGKNCGSDGCEGSCGDCTAPEFCDASGQCQPEQCQPTNEGIEACDQVDNDCDGQVDEDFATGTACDGIGECGQGQLECLTTDSAICSTDLGGSQFILLPELCDGLDNDCDGEVDEELAPSDTCEAGLQVHDGIDNNCNGLVDEPGGCMVPIPGSSVWIDSFESTVFGNADCTGARYGESADDYPAGWPADGLATTVLYACSLPGLVPSGRLSWYRAQRACQAQGKRMCSRAEWTAACGGLSLQAFPYGESFQVGTCGDFSIGGQPQEAGTLSGCVSPAGSNDMSGNLTEWVADVCSWDASMTTQMGGSVFCDYSGSACDAGSPEQADFLLELYGCGQPGTNSWCDSPASSLAYYGGRCCWDGP